MPTPSNALNISSAGLVKFDGTSTFSGVTVTQFDVLIGAASNGITSVGPGSAGQILQSGGGAGNPTYSTPTYPSASGTSGKIIQSDGTNNIYSNFTMASPGTLGNVLTSDGTNWISSAGGGSGLLSASWTLTSAQIKALHGTPIQVIPAPGLGKVIFVVSPIYSKFNYGGTNVFIAGAGQTINLTYGTSILNAGVLLPNTSITGTNTTYAQIPATLQSAPTPANMENTALNLFNPVATEISGNAANNNTASGIVIYYIATLP